MTNPTNEARNHVDIINSHRNSRGMRLLRISQILTDAATFKAQDMADRDYFSHVEPSGRTARQLLTDHGYPINAWTGENILYGTDGAQKTFDAWFNSMPHRENMLNPNYTEIGVAIGVEPRYDFSGDVYLVGVQELGSSSTPEATGVAKSNGQIEQGAPKNKRRTQRTLRPRLPSSYPPLQERENEALGRKIKNRVLNMLKGRNK